MKSAGLAFLRTKVAGSVVTALRIVKTYVKTSNISVTVPAGEIYPISRVECRNVSKCGRVSTTIYRIMYNLGYLLLILVGTSVPIFLVSMRETKRILTLSSFGANS